MRFGRRCAVAALGVTLALPWAGAGFATAAPATGAGRVSFGDVSCTAGSFDWQVGPSIMMWGDKATQFTGYIDFGNCESLTYPKIHSGKGTFKATANAGCEITSIDGHINNGIAKGEIVWDTGQKSVFGNGSWRGTLYHVQMQHANIIDGFLKGGLVEFTADNRDANPATNAVGCSAFGIGIMRGELRQISITGSEPDHPLPPCSVLRQAATTVSAGECPKTAKS
jgi:hypothetical protein